MHLAREGSNFHAQIEYDLYIMNSEIGSSYFKLQTEGKMRRLKKLGEAKNGKGVNRGHEGVHLIPLGIDAISAYSNLISSACTLQCKH